MKDTQPVNGPGMVVAVVLIVGVVSFVVFFPIFALWVGA